MFDYRDPHKRVDRIGMKWYVLRETGGALWESKVGVPTSQLKVRKGFQGEGIPTLGTLLGCDQGEDERSRLGNGNREERAEGRLSMMTSWKWSDQSMNELWSDRALIGLKHTEVGPFPSLKGATKCLGRYVYRTASPPGHIVGCLHGNQCGDCLKNAMMI